ncbi:MAG: type II secretion system F family protein [Pseudomonadota bacterium]
MFGDDATVGGMLAALFAGAAAAFSIAAFYIFANSTAQESRVKKRMAAVKQHRSSVRAAAQGAIANRTATDGSIAQMSDVIDKLNMKKQLEDQELKLRMLRAGLRDRSHLVRFVFMQIALPPALGLGFYLAYQFLAKPEEFNLVITMGVIFMGIAIGYIYPGMRIDGMAETRQKAIRRAYPDALDLLTICVESGMSVEQGFNKVANEVGGDAIELSEELQITTAELSYLGDRRKALENFANRTGMQEVKSITSALIQADKYGTPVGEALRVISAESRFDRMARAETKAASLPAMLTVPMMVFFVPVLFVVILGPAIIQVMETFS